MVEIVVSKYTPAIVLFVIFLFVYFTVWAIRFFGHDESHVRRFPPWLSPCPDYWTHQNGRCFRTTDAANGRDKCGPLRDNYNSQVGAPPNGHQMAYTSVSDPSTNESSGVDLSKFSWPDKCKWAKSCDIYWEGVSDKDCGDKDAFSEWGQ